MNRDRLKNILQSNYSRASWINTLQFLSGNKNLLTVSLEPQQIILTTKKAQEIVRNLYQLGTLKTTDGITLPIFEIELQENIKIEYNKVGVNQLIKEYILKDAGKGAIATYFYESEKNKEWRFSFISKFGGSEFFEEVEDVETNPKKYTYIFGTPEEHRTALERLYNLEQSNFKLEDFFEAFNVEPVSNNFFKEYKNFYLDFVGHLSSNEVCRKVFEDEKTEDVEKDIRNFVKRLLGRIVFLYFLQKKRWLGATNINYEDGDTNFLLHLFEADKEQFYSNWLSKLFFNALNTPDRNKDGFKLSEQYFFNRSLKESDFVKPNNEELAVPFLNGGLFEELQEPKAHRSLKFPAFLFDELFTFFNGYNFTIYENSPEDHTVAVDPEMLGNIFENLLEDNNDKGTFYTPKEIVHYMTQESLIEYLNTHLKDKSKAQIENLVKNQVRDNITREDLKTIEDLIDKVKICDPAIGSGAFPMGLLQEIFSLKAFIHYELGYDVWSPAKIKQDIIQNSIYGVDLEGDAVDISRLRFWLSLVVDEDKPKPLPNLDYKIMQGNSLLESYNGIDLSNVSSGKNLKITEAQRDLFGNLKDNQINLTFDKVGIAESISEKTDKYFTASVIVKPILKKEIDDLVNEFIAYNIELRENQLLRWINEQNEQDNTLSDKRKKQLITWQNSLENHRESKDSLYDSNKKSNNYFLWHLFFKDVFDNGGFDIVIGNPPYVDSETMVKVNKNEREIIKNSYKTTTGNWDLFIPFVEKGLNICKTNAHFSYIIPNKLISAKYTKSLKEFISNYEIIEIRDYSKINVFKEANVYPITFSALTKSPDRKVKMTVMESIDRIDYSNLIETEVFYEDVSWSKYFFSPKIIKIILTIENNILLKDFSKNLKILGSATVSEAYQVKEKLFDSFNVETDYKKLVNTGTIDPYISLWGIKDTQYIKHKYSNPVIKDIDIQKMNPTRFEQAKSPKIIIAGMSKIIEAFIDVKGEYLAGKSTSIIIEEKQKLDVILPIISSKLYTFYINHKYHSLKMAGGYFNISVEIIRNLPFIRNINNEKTFINLSNCIAFLLSGNNINDTIKNEHIAQFFQEVIDGCVFELFFKEHMLEKSINIIDLAQEEIKKVLDEIDIKDMDEPTKRQNIWGLYKNIKNSEVQQRMRLFVAKSPDILKPILQS